jgi:hypothetical protein
MKDWTAWFVGSRSSVLAAPVRFARMVDERRRWVAV